MIFPAGGRIGRSDQQCSASLDDAPVDAVFDEVNHSGEGEFGPQAAFSSAEKGGLLKGSGNIDYAPPSDWAERQRLPRQMGALRHVLRSLSWCEGKAALLCALWRVIKRVDPVGASSIVGIFSRYPARRLMDAYCKDHVLSHEMRQAYFRHAHMAAAGQPPSCCPAVCQARKEAAEMPLKHKDQSNPVEGGNHENQDIVEAYANLASKSTPKELAECEESFALVARSVSKKEVRENPEADKACKAEWERLEQTGCWDVDTVAEWKDVRAKAGSTIHIGPLHELCVEKG